ncbi:WD40 repeat domain-containing protein [Aporhodopirellula aestuarii]|uniref:WD40 repeat domain-containing protein n=1 Tax=Aporhodopirellula aestuarii TaxID=2950107 RepID=A0ABT0U6Z0_9BACT|nr:WD40 repeat domain-containing protein [Aporhodopirellula aestuarii]MCM2372310.1 WD40 repeat domain-containing protein [Aporhodopirellula aestuarii]
MDSRFLSIAWRLNQGYVLTPFFFSFFFLFPVFRLAAAPLDDESVKPLTELHFGTTQGRTQPIFSPDGSLLATSRRLNYGTTLNSVIRRGVDLIIWDVETGDAKAKIADGWLGFAFNNSGSVLAVWTDQEVSILDPESGNRLATLVHRDVEHAQFLLQAELLVTQTRGREQLDLVPSELRFWNTKTWERVETKIDRSMPLISPTVSADGKYVAGYKPAPQNVKNGTSQLKLWEVETGRELPIPKLLPDSLRTASTGWSGPLIGFTRDGKSLFVSHVCWEIEAAKLKPISNSFDLERDVSWFSLYVHPRLHSQHSKKRARIIEGKIFVWDSHEGEPIAKFINPVKEQPVNTVPQLNFRHSIQSLPWVFDNALGFTTKDEYVVSRTVDIWETANGKIARSIALDEPDLQLGGKHWKVDSTSPLVRVAKDGKTIVVLEAGRNDLQKQRSCRIAAYDFATGKRQYQLSGHNHFVSSLCLSPDSRLIATGSGAIQQWDAKTGEVKLWDLKTGELVRTIIDQGGKVLCLAFDSRGEHLAIGRIVSQSGPEVGLWEVSTGTKLLSLQLPPSNAVVRSPSENKYEKRQSSLSSPSESPYGKHQNTLSKPHSLAFSSDDKLLAVGGNAQLSLWNMPNGEFRSIDRIYGPVHQLQFSKDGEKLYLGTNHLYEVRVSELRGRGDSADQLTRPSADRSEVISRYWKFVLQPSAKQVFRPTDVVLISGEFAMIASDRLIASCPASFHTINGEISLWDVENKELLEVFNHNGVRSVDFTPDSQLVTGSIRPERFTTTILDPETGRLVVRLGHSRGASIQFSPEGEVVAVLRMVPRSTKLIRHHRGYLQAERTSSVAGIDLWDTRTGRMLGVLSHEAATGFHFSPDGKILASVGPKSIKLWQVSEFTHGAAD